MASLYVADLEPDVNAAMLFAIFGPVGDIVCIALNNAQSTGSLSYAFVFFKSQSDAERALDTLNYARIRGRPCRIIWSHKLCLLNNGAARLWINGLDKNIDDRGLYDTFSLFGEILTCNVAVDAAGNSCGYGFVHYEVTAAAEAARERVDGMMIGESVVELTAFPVDWFEEISSDSHCESSTGKICVTNVDKNVDDKGIHDAFSRFGRILTCKMAKDPLGNSYGYGFVEFEADKAAQRALERADGIQIGNKKVKISTFPFNFEEDKGRSGYFVFLTNLDQKVDEKTLSDFFSQYGKIVFCHLVVHPMGASCGAGFVQFENEDTAKQASERVNDVVIVGKMGKMFQISTRSYLDWCKEMPNIDWSLHAPFSCSGEITGQVAKDQVENSYGYVPYQVFRAVQRFFQVVQSSLEEGATGVVLITLRNYKELLQMHELLHRAFKAKEPPFYKAGEKIADFEDIRLKKINLEDLNDELEVSTRRGKFAVLAPQQDEVQTAHEAMEAHNNLTPTGHGKVKSLLQC